MAGKKKMEVPAVNDDHGGVQKLLIEEKSGDAPILVIGDAPVRKIVTPEMLIIDRSPQGSPEWHQARAGCSTGSCFIDIIGETKPDKSGKTKPLKARENYLWMQVTEVLYGTPKENVSSQSLQWGHDTEPYAREAYEAETGFTVIEAGFIRRIDIDGVGVSLDGMVKKEGTVEIKCPKDSTIHMQTWLNGMPEEHRPQVQGGLWISGRDWCDYISYDPRAPKHMRLYVERIYRDEAYIAELERKVMLFRGEVNELVIKLCEKVFASNDECAEAAA